MVNNTLFKFVTIIVLILITISVIVYISRTSLQIGSAPSGLQATVATTSFMVVGPSSANVIFATSTCSARIISTAERAIYITFDDKRTPTGTFGHHQAASTTVAYDSGLYGCDRMKIFGVSASSSIIVTETR